jgi:hypothetical protein
VRVPGAESSRARPSDHLDVSLGQKKSVNGRSYDVFSAAVGRVKVLAAVAGPPNQVASESFLNQTDHVRRKMGDAVHENKAFSVPRPSLTEHCEIFKDDPTLLTSPDEVKSRVVAATLELFGKAIEGSDSVISRENPAELQLL